MAGLHYHEYMVRWALFTFLAVTAWAQTTGPVSAESESRLRERIGKFSH